MPYKHVHSPLHRQFSNSVCTMRVWLAGGPGERDQAVHTHCSWLTFSCARPAYLPAFFRNALAELSRELAISPRKPSQLVCQRKKILQIKVGYGVRVYRTYTARSSQECKCTRAITVKAGHCATISHIYIRLVNCCMNCTWSRVRRNFFTPICTRQCIKTVVDVDVQVDDCVDLAGKKCVAVVPNSDLLNFLPCNCIPT